ncbi:MerR family transcriptional regulator [Persicitalea jodogahamensis]|uniref:MerR family transcriptional regulator n=1 Tax=Persicitalea jodogahamensis TaxID=402147 RepID=A0A8J3G890_9BACT|nr:MerR family transcriptional regulator [Persicitalea jodogahamensis]GHB54214.1 MerR family transcriptional regulator [Persicitalea jodogahamensis]
MSSYSIRDLEQLSGIKAHTLRIWEQRYNIIEPQRTDTNIRTYDDQDMKLVLNISLLKAHGYKISKISKMTPEQMHAEVVAISDRKLSYPDQIHALTLSMLDLDEERFEKIISTNILKFGFEDSMINIIYPFLSRIGTLWVTGSVGPAQEHFISNLIRQKIIVAIDGQVVRQTPQSKTFLLFLPEGELHEMGLLFANYILRARNNKVVYLGQSLPFHEIEFAHKIHRPDYIFAAITSVPAGNDVQPYVDRLAAEFPESTILLTGYQIVGQGIKTAPNVILINKIQDLIQLAAS